MFVEFEIVIPNSIGMGYKAVTEIVMVALDVFTNHVKTFQISELAFVARLGTIDTVKCLDQLIKNVGRSGEVAN